MNSQYAPDLLPPLLETPRRLLVDRGQPRVFKAKQRDDAPGAAPVGDGATVLVDERAARLFMRL